MGPKSFKLIAKRLDAKSAVLTSFPEPDALLNGPDGPPGKPGPLGFDGSQHAQRGGDGKEGQQGRSGQPAGSVEINLAVFSGTLRIDAQGKSGGNGGGGGAGGHGGNGYNGRKATTLYECQGSRAVHMGGDAGSGGSGEKRLTQVRVATS